MKFNPFKTVSFSDNIAQGTGCLSARLEKQRSPVIVSSKSAELWGTPSAVFHPTENERVKGQYQEKQKCFGPSCWFLSLHLPGRSSHRPSTKHNYQHFFFRSVWPKNILAELCDRKENRRKMRLMPLVTKGELRGIVSLTWLDVWLLSQSPTLGLISNLAIQWWVLHAETPEKQSTATLSPQQFVSITPFI